MASATVIQSCYSVSQFVSGNQSRVCLNCLIFLPFSPHHFCFDSKFYWLEGFIWEQYCQHATRNNTKVMIWRYVVPCTSCSTGRSSVSQRFDSSDMSLQVQYTTLPTPGKLQLYGPLHLCSQILCSEKQDLFNQSRNIYWWMNWSSLQTRFIFLSVFCSGILVILKNQPPILPKNYSTLYKSTYTVKDLEDNQVF